MGYLLGESVKACESDRGKESKGEAERLKMRKKTVASLFTPGDLHHTQELLIKKTASCLPIPFKPVNV